MVFSLSEVSDFTARLHEGKAVVVFDRQPQYLEDRNQKLVEKYWHSQPVKPFTLPFELFFFALLQQWDLSVHARVLTTIPTGVCVRSTRRTIFSSVSLLLAFWSILT